MLPRDSGDEIQRHDAARARVLAREDRRAREGESATTTHTADPRPAQNPLASAPWFVQLALASPTALVLVVLLGQATGWIPSVAQRQSDAIMALDMRLSTHVTEASVGMTRVTTALRVLCENSAKDDVARTNCRLIQ